MTKHIAVPEELLEETVDVLQELETHIPVGATVAVMPKLRALLNGPGVEPVAYHDKDQPEGIAWCPGYPEKLKDICPLYTQASVQAVQEAVEKLEACDKTLRELRGKYPVQAVPDLAKGQIWHVMRHGATACCTLEVVEVTTSTVLFKSPGYCNEERLPISDVRFVELIAAPQQPATTDKENGNG